MGPCRRRPTVLGKRIVIPLIVHWIVVVRLFPALEHVVFIEPYDGAAAQLSESILVAQLLERLTVERLERVTAALLRAEQIARLERSSFQPE